MLKMETFLKENKLYEAVFHRRVDRNDPDTY